MWISPVEGSEALVGSAEAQVALLEVGRIARAHGVRGEVVVELVTDRDERLAPGSVLTIGHDGRPGTPEGPCTLEVRHASRMGGPSGSGRTVRGRWIVDFAGVADRSAADALRSAVLLAPPLEDPEALWVHEIIGAEVFDVHGSPLGRVAEVEANPASDLLVLDGGGLIPMCFLVDGGIAEGPAHKAAAASPKVVVDIPDGLLD